MSSCWQVAIGVALPRTWNVVTPFGGHEREAVSESLLSEESDRREAGIELV